jgi:rSAM/selenodomain-associated transferase 1
MRRIAVFARWPMPGRVKSRLSPALPPPLACALHRGMIEDTLEAVARSACDARLLYWADAPGDRRGFVAPPGFEERDQEGADLGERLARAFGELLRAPEDRALVVGSDCPALEPARLADAFDALDAHELVLGPTRDGGYYLIGLSRAAPALFQGIEWGTASVHAQTLERARASGLTAAELGVLDDIDTPADLVRFVAAGADAAPRATHTRAALEAIGLLPAVRVS